MGFNAVSFGSMSNDHPKNLQRVQAAPLELQYCSKRG